MNKNHDKLGRFASNSIHLVGGLMYSGKEVNALAKKHGGAHKIPGYGGVYGTGGTAPKKRRAKSISPPAKSKAKAKAAKVDPNATAPFLLVNKKPPVEKLEAHPPKKVAKGHEQHKGKKMAPPASGMSKTVFAEPLSYTNAQKDRDAALRMLAKQKTVPAAPPPMSKDAMYEDMMRRYGMGK